MENKIVDKSRHFQAISILILLIGLALMAYMIVVEDEPGALPLLLI